MTWITPFSEGRKMMLGVLGSSVAQVSWEQDESKTPNIKRLNLNSKGKEDKDQPRDQKRLKAILDVENSASITPSVGNSGPVAEGSGDCVQQSIGQNGKLLLLHSGKLEEHEGNRKSVSVEDIKKRGNSVHSDRRYPVLQVEAKVAEERQRLYPVRRLSRRQDMAEIEEETMEPTTVVEEPKITVAAGKGKSGFYALKWVLDNVVTAGAVVYLLHVQAPLRYIPTPMGSNLPVDQVSTELVNKFKMQRFQETENLLNQYRQMCVKRKVEPKVCYSESDLVQKELVEQISSLGIAKLVLGTSSQSRLAKAFKGQGISAFVAKHAPDFCTVLVINKGKLYSAKDATKSLFPDSILGRSMNDSSFLTGSVTEGDRTRTMQIGDDGSNSNTQIGDGGARPRLFESASIDLTHNPSEWLSTYDPTYKTGFHSPAVEIISWNGAGTSGGRHIESAPPTPMVQPKNSRIYQAPGNMVQHLSFGNGQVSEIRMAPVTPIRNISIENLLLNTWQMDEDRMAPATPLENFDRSASLIVDDSSVGENGHSDIEAPPHVSLEPTGLESPNSNCSQESTSAQLKSEAEMAEELEMLKRQLKHAKITAEKAQRDADIQAIRCKRAEEVVATAMNMVAEYDAQRKEELRMQEDAFRDVEIAKQQAEAEARRREDALEEARKVALRDVEISRQKLEEETRKHKKAIEDSRRIIEDSIRDADAARQQAAVETIRLQEALASLEEAKKSLEVEGQLRREAEEKARQEAIAKQEALAALRRTQERYTEYNFAELQEATQFFSEDQKLGEGGYGGVYKGKIRHTTVAVKVLKPDGLQGHQEFQREVELLSRIHHPHMVMLLGACPEQACIVYEYMANGSLEDRLNCKHGTPPLPWYIRFRICSEVATALLFLHSSRPEPVVHRDLKPGNILLDHNFVSKIGDVGLARLVPNNMTFSITMYRDTVPVGTFAYIDPDYQRTGVVSPQSDVYALGIVMLQLLTGKAAVGVTNLVEEAVDSGRLHEVLDWSAGEWPLPEAMELACLSLQCAEPKRKHRPDLETRVLGALENIRMLADVAAASEASKGLSFSGREPIIPSFFLCPISQEVMENPHIAADGFTYEYEAIKAWLHGHNTSPMTNLRLSHKNLIPNHSLRSAIKEWQAKGLIRM